MKAPAPSKRKFDVVVWGATGFTGRLVAEYLFEQYGADGALRWAMGGRNAGKLETVRRDIGAEAVPLIVGDSQDSDTLRKMVRQTRVVCTTVGPYAKYGSELVAACAANGTHYCDLAGEAQWIRRMIDRHEAQARQSGARIVNCCGFDSIPSDLGCLFLQDTAIESLGGPCDTVRLAVVKLRGASSGGTVASVLNAIDEARKDKAARRVLTDPYALYPRGERRGPDRRDQSGPAYDPDLRGWTGPFIMAAINAKVVRRSNALMGFAYGRDFRYSEVTRTGAGAIGLMSAVALTGGLAGFMMLATPAPTRALLSRLFLPQPGEGPSREKRDNGCFEIVLTGRRGDGDPIRVRVTGDRDPGYGATSRMLGESAVCLALDRTGGAQPAGGFWTPASAMGRMLIERLTDKAGMSFAQEPDTR